MRADPTEWLAHYERGVFTRDCLLSMFVEAAVDEPPNQIAKLIPSEWQLDIRALAAVRHDPQRCISIIGGTFDRSFDSEVHNREMTRRYLAGLNAWRDYFAAHSIASVAPPGLGDS